MTDETPQAPAAPAGFDIGAAATEFYEKFPAFNGRVTFVDLSAGKVVNSDPEKFEQVMGMLGDGGSMPPEVRSIITDCMKKRSSYTWEDAKGDHIIFMYTGEDRPAFFGDAVSHARELQFIFDHETGHVVVPEGSSQNRLLAENAADAFALLTDLNRHGGDTSLAEAALFFRTSFAMFSSMGILNFSSPLIEKMLETNGDIAKEATTPAEMVALAGKLALENTMEVSAAQELHASLAKLKGHADLATLTGVVLETPLPDTFKWTSSVLKAALDRRVRLPGQREEEFNAIAAGLPEKIAAREQFFAAQAPKPPAPAPHVQAAKAPKSPSAGPAP